jgi:hypothetical protein
MIPLIACIAPHALASPTWQELRSGEGWEKLSDYDMEGIGPVAVHRKTIGGLSCFMGTATTEVGTAALLSVATDIEGVDNWSSASLPESETLGTGPSHVDYYQYLDVPIFSDRFWFLRGYIEEEGGIIRFRWERLDAGGPYPERHAEVLRLHPSAEEPPVNIGAWSFIAGTGATAVEYHICAHPGGLVPPGLQAIGTQKNLPHNLRDLVVEGRRRSG